MTTSNTTLPSVGLSTGNEITAGGSSEPTPAILTEPTIASNDSFSKTKPISESIKYRVEYRNVDTNNLVHTFQYNQREFDIANLSRPSIFEIVTTYLTGDSEFKSENAKDKEGPLVTDTRKKVTMVIHSQAIINALRSVVEYYPSQNLFGQSISIQEPYPILVHHEKELAEFRERCNPAHLDGPLCIREKDAYNHLKVLLDFLEETVIPAVRSEQERNINGTGSSEMLWLRMRPGTTISTYIDSSRLQRDCVVESVTGGVFDQEGKPWLIKYWYLDYDGTFIGRCKGEVVRGVEPGKIGDITGELTFGEPQKLQELPIKHDKIEEINYQVNMGKKFFDLLVKKCQYYNGKSVTVPETKIEGLVMVDLDFFYSKFSEERPDVTFSTNEKGWVSDCFCSACRGRQKESKNFLFSNYDGLTPTDTLTPHQLFLLPKTIWVFVFKTRAWWEVYTANLSEPVFNKDMINTLVMDAARLQMIKALAGTYIRENKHGEKLEPPWNADFIPGKGEGQIFLLHGKPGVGKSYTAECIAQYTQRPLMVLTSSDIGTSTETIEGNLRGQFLKAENWGAILLIDEADVFMEQRSTNDLNRNSLVAGFLRALEFYKGILFLTTNRVGTFDEAFISRIHVQLYYPDFSDDDRQRIWKVFMDKLSSERGKSIRISIDAREYIRGREIKALKWNGREIRNAFQTAVALAEYESIKDEEGKILLNESHLSAIVKMSADFKNYLEKVHLADENKRAQRQGLRFDEER